MLSLVSFKLEMEAKIREAISYRSSPGHLGLIDMGVVVGFTDGGTLWFRVLFPCMI